MTDKQIIKKWYSNHKYYDSTTIRESKDEFGHSVDIALIYSGRNRGKSFDISSKAILDAWKSQGKEQFGYLRRLDKELKLANVSKYFDDKHDFIVDITDKQADSIRAYSDGLYFTKDIIEDDKQTTVRVLKCGDIFALSNAYQYKSLQYPNITRLIFEEVFINGRYLTDECDKLMSIISTIQRDRDNFICFMISNTVSVINPYTQGLSLSNIRSQQAGTIDFYKLYKGVFDKEGNEEYYYIACEYLKDADNEQPKLLDSKRKRLTSISSNKWEELHNYIHCSNKLMCEYFTDNMVVFEWNTDRFLAHICNVPYNIEDIIEGYYNEDNIKPSDELFTILYIERKSTPTKTGTRLYTNIARVDPYSTYKFKRKYEIDNVVNECLYNGYCIYANNLTGNEFNQILKELY